METRNHFALGRHILDSSGYAFKRAHRAAFIFGNIFPDINIFSYFRGHTYEGCYSALCRRIEKLKARRRLSVYDMFQLGASIHYLADFFTTPHNKKFLGGLYQHYRYEKSLRPLFRRSLPALEKLMKRQLPRPGPEKLGDLIRRIHLSYLSKSASFENDCFYITSMCSRMFNALLPPRAAALAIGR